MIRNRTKRPSPGRPPATEAAERLEKILDIAAEVFLEKGYEHTSVSEIVRRACASKRTLYSRFPTKADLFSAVMQRRSEAGINVLADIVRSNGPVDQVLGIYADILILPLVEKEKLRLVRAVIVSAESFPEVAHAFWEVGPARVHQILGEFLKERMAIGELRQDDPMRAAQLFISLCTGRFWAHSLMCIRPRITKAETQAHRDLVVQCFLGFYRPSISVL
jgi:TetR/AcrR family transcriptional regulator, mexJK operon transcriptional repressor